MNKKFFIELNDETYTKLYNEYLKVLKSPMYVTLETKPSFEEFISSILVSYTQKMDEMANLISGDSLENMKKQLESLFGSSAGFGDLNDLFSSMLGKTDSKKPSKKEDESNDDSVDISKLKS